MLLWLLFWLGLSSRVLLDCLRSDNAQSGPPSCGSISSTIEIKFRILKPAGVGVRSVQRSRRSNRCSDTTARAAQEYGPGARARWKRAIPGIRARYDRRDLPGLS